MLRNALLHDSILSVRRAGFIVVMFLGLVELTNLVIRTERCCHVSRVLF